MKRAILTFILLICAAYALATSASLAAAAVPGVLPAGAQLEVASDGDDPLEQAPHACMKKINGVSIPCPVAAAPIGDEALCPPASGEAARYRFEDDTVPSTLLFEQLRPPRI